MATYILVDTANLFNRAKHVTSGDIDLKIGMAMHIMFNGIRKAWRDFNGTHVVFFLEGRSWRREFYAPYKANRDSAADSRTKREREEDGLFYEALDAMCTYVNDKTNASVLRNPIAEADDLIALWVQTHPQDQHVIISTDSDFYQLIAPNVSQYNGVTETTYTLDGVYDAKGRPVIDKKTKMPVTIGDPQYVLFLKCIRGDKSDNVFSAYPGAPKKGTKKRTGIQQAYDDKDTGGYHYNNLMLQKWTDHNGAEHRVRDDYTRNSVLIDLTAQPEQIRLSCAETVRDAVNKPAVTGVGIHFLKFCTRWDLKRLSDAPDEFAKILNAGIKNSTSTLARAPK